MNEVEKVARGAAWILLGGVIVRALDSGFDDRPLLALAFGAFTVDFLAQRTGVRWAEAEAAGKSKYLEALRGLGIGIAIALAIVLASRLLGMAQMGTGSPSLLLVMSAARPLLQAMRDELLFRGMPLAIARGRFSDKIALPFAALLGAAPLVTLPGIRPEALLLTVSSGLFFGLLWRAGGGLLAWGAHAGWLFAADLAIRGVLLDVSFSEGAIAPAARASGWPAFVAAAGFAMGSVVMVMGRRRRAALVLRRPQSP